MFEASFVGRDSELARLVSTLRETVRSGRPGFLVVEGAPGIGKSRLVRELVAVARASTPSSTILQEWLDSSRVKPSPNRSRELS